MVLKFNDKFSKQLQQEVFADKTRFKVIAAGRRCGKSRLSAVTLLIEGLQCSAGSAVLYVAPTNGQARQIIWDVLMELGREVIQASHINNMDITLINGAKIYVRGADRPDTLRGVSLTYAVLDEVADIKPEAWEQVIRASLSDKKGRAMFIGTPKGRNFFYDIFRLGMSEEDSDWKSWHFTTKDNPLIDPTEIESAKKTLSSFAFKQGRDYKSALSRVGLNGSTLPQWAATIADRMPDYPHAAITIPDRKKQTTRLIKVACLNDNYIVRVSRSTVDAMGCPICPACRAEMVVA